MLRYAAFCCILCAVHVASLFIVWVLSAFTGIPPCPTSNIHGILNVHARTLHQGELQLAEKLYRNALDGQDQLGVGDSDETAVVLNNLGHVLAELGKVDEAESLYRRAIEVWKNQEDNGGGLLATGMSNLAGLLKRRGNVDEAEALYNKALAFDLVDPPPPHPAPQPQSPTAAATALPPPTPGPRITTVSHKPAHLPHPHIHHIKRPGQRLWGEEHPDVATDLNNLASLATSKVNKVNIEISLLEYVMSR